MTDFTAQGANAMNLGEFWTLPPRQAETKLLAGIQQVHTWHFSRNPAYRRAVAARGMDETFSPENLSRLLRPTSQTFKSYIDLLGTPFPQDKPSQFLEWVDDQLSIDLPKERFSLFRSRYGSLEALLADFERIFADFGLEILTSSGTSGRSTIMIRDQDGIARTVESFYLAFQRYLGMKAEHRAIFVMPRLTRIAMVRMASFSVRQIGLPENHIHYTIPFPAYPDQVRIRSGRTYRSGWRGLLERRALNPLMNWANDRLVMPKTIRQTVELLRLAQANGEKVLLFGGWIQLHSAALEILAYGRPIQLAMGSLLGTGGGFKEQYPFTPRQIQEDLSRAILLEDGTPAPLRDVYGMAEGNWAAMQCRQGNYHIPPWIYAGTLDNDDQFQRQTAGAGKSATGLLAFFDPYGGGRLFPAFFKTADRVTLANLATDDDHAAKCACGEDGAYILKDSIQRVDLVDEAGCAAQV